MFLLCNGLLVFIAMNSGLINTPSSSTSITTKEEKEVAFVYNINRSSSQLEELNAPEIATPLAHETVVMEIESPTPQDEEKSLEIAEQESLAVLGTELEDGDEDEANALMIIDEDVHHSTEDIEELNKKCEDFIRKMKAAIWSEPRAVYFDNRTAMVTVN
ncbi:hypothetical protein RIF29_23890 [Crotalaria pallida]|uniref:Uncharacterized protein n=1 Tax=Crotalaria pallida TaxID=3830 RepID=A0AAN9EIS6_CROPI